MRVKMHLDVGQILAAEFARIQAELDASPFRTARDDHAAFCRGIEAVIRAQKAAGHPEPLFMIASLANASQSAPESPHRFTHKEFSTQSEVAGGVNPTAATERAKRALSIALINLLMRHGSKAAPAAHIVASAIGADAKKLVTAKNNASRKDKKSDLDAMLRDAEKHVKGVFIKHRRTLKKAEALTATIDAVATRIRSY